MTPYTLIPPKVYPSAAHTKNKVHVLAVYLKQTIDWKTSVSDVTKVYKKQAKKQA